MTLFNPSLLAQMEREKSKIDQLVVAQKEAENLANSLNENSAIAANIFIEEKFLPTAAQYISCFESSMFGKIAIEDDGEIYRGYLRHFALKLDYLNTKKSTLKIGFSRRTDETTTEISFAFEIPTQSGKNDPSPIRFDIATLSNDDLVDILNSFIGQTIGMNTQGWPRPSGRR